MPSLEGAAAGSGAALLSVHGRSTSSGAFVRPGFFVSSGGIAVTVLSSTDDVVVELASGERRRARVLLRDDDGLALLDVTPLGTDGAFPALGLQAKAFQPQANAWLVGFDIQKNGPAPVLGGLRSIDARGRWRLDLPAGPGAPILSGSRVVGVVLERAGSAGSWAVPSTRIQALAERWTAKRTATTSGN